MSDRLLSMYYGWGCITEVAAEQVSPLLQALRVIDARGMTRVHTLDIGDTHTECPLPLITVLATLPTLVASLTRLTIGRSNMATMDLTQLTTLTKLDQLAIRAASHLTPSQTDVLCHLPITVLLVISSHSPGKPYTKAYIVSRQRLCDRIHSVTITYAPCGFGSGMYVCMYVCGDIDGGRCDLVMAHSWSITIACALRFGCVIVFVVRVIRRHHHYHCMSLLMHYHYYLRSPDTSDSINGAYV